VNIESMKKFQMSIEWRETTWHFSLTVYVCESFEADPQIMRGTANMFDEAFMNLAS
jgi:hypothetical protein